MILSRVLFFSVQLALLGCGVKGDPLPPETPATLGRGRPTFQKAVRDVKPVPVDRIQRARTKDENKDEKE